ncbi:MAG TPA: NADH-quinone oxidoreductase subunit G, partial [Streptosporangiaceae bacterium]|nr:NADH-quinone oxidoreductase subunit G [Streptosporangiaceae bacterium]
TLDGKEVEAREGEVIIAAAERAGVYIPRFCYHPRMKPVGMCRMCLVEVEGVRGFPPACTTPVAEGMVCNTQSDAVKKIQDGVLEFLLVNHPLDCPVCDRGGECPLQDQTLAFGPGESRFVEEKRHFEKPIELSDLVLLDRERCIQCGRCTRFADEIAGDALIDFVDRGDRMQVLNFAEQPFDSYFSGNTVQICPVGALTGASYRFRARPFDLVSTPSVCEHCAAGCRQRTDHRRGAVTRRLAGSDPLVNEEWNCDKGRWAFTYTTQPDRLVSPLVRNEAGVLEPASWPEAVAAAASGLQAARGRAGVLTGGRLTVEDAYGYAKFARLALGSNDIDLRARPHSAEEAQFLADHVAGRGLGVSYADLERAPAVLLAGFEPEDESPIVFLRLRKAVRQRGLAVYSIAALASPGLGRLSGVLLPTVPGAEAEALSDLTAGPADAGPGAAAPGSAAGAGIAESARAAAAALRLDGAIILAGERLAEVPGALSAAARLAEVTGARLAWIPRRAGERGAIEAGALPGLLPGGRQVTDPAARAEVARSWGTGSLPAEPGRDTAQILAAAADGEIDALVIAGVDPADLPDPAAALTAMAATAFIVSLELRASAVTDRADVVLPVAAVAEKAGTYLNWEGRPGSFGPALQVPAVQSDLQVLGEIADEMDVHLGLPSAAAARAELAALAPAIAAAGAQAGQPESAPAGSPRPVTAGGRPPVPQAAVTGQIGQLGRSHPGPGAAMLATWHQLLDAGRLQDGEPNLAGTARAAVAMMSAATAAEAGTADGDKVTVATIRGAVTVPVRTADMPDRVVWLPANSAGCAVRSELGAGHGTLVTVR